MARIEEKSIDKKEVVNKVVIGVVVTFLSLILVASIVILILWLVEKNENESEFEEKFPTGELISFEELNLILDNDEHSELLEGKQEIFIYVYSPDYEEDDEESVAAGVHDYVESCINAYKEFEGEFSFYIVNVTEEENVEYLNENPNFLSSYGLDIDYPFLLVCGPLADGAEKPLTEVAEINNMLQYAINQTE